MKDKRRLIVELQGYENQGISIWLDDIPSDSDEIVGATMHINESSSYMRDYVFERGKVVEIHFRLITKK